MMHGAGALPLEGALMYDVAAILIALACFAFVFVLIEVFDRV
jgi:hypothetical protein